MKYDNLTTAQRELARIPLEQILTAADGVPERPEPRLAEDMLPVIRKLRNKRLSWPDITAWMRDHTEFDRSATFWAMLHKGKKIGIRSIITFVPNDPKLSKSVE